MYRVYEDSKMLFYEILFFREALILGEGRLGKLRKLVMQITKDDLMLKTPFQE